MPVLLYTYLAAEILAPFYASFLILNGVLFLGKLVPFLTTIFDFGVGFADFLRICAYIMPNLLLFSIPMASMLGVIICFSRLAVDNEIMAMKGCGISFYRLIPPVAVFAVCTALLTGLCSTRLIPAGEVSMKKLLFQLAKEKIDKGLQQQHFSQGIKDMVIYVDRIDPHTNSWHGVYVADLRKKETAVNILARTGNLDAHVEDMRLNLNLEDGAVNRFSGDSFHTVQFKKYVLNLQIEQPKSIEGYPVTQVSQGEMSQRELLEKAGQSGRKSAAGASLLIEYHKRLVLSAGCLVLSLLGLPLAVRSFGPKARSTGLSMGLCFFVCYYILFTACKSISETSTLPIGLIMWSPNILFGVIAAHLIRKTAREADGGILDHLAHIPQKIVSRFTGLGKK